MSFDTGSLAAVASPSPTRRPARAGDTALLVLMVVTLAVLSFLILHNGQQAVPDANTSRRSTFVAAPGGWKAYYLLLKQRGDDVGRLVRSPRYWPRSASVIITGPYGDADWTEEEADEALRWVDRGGVLVAFTGGDGAFCTAIGVSLQAGSDDTSRAHVQHTHEPLSSEPDDSPYMIPAEHGAPGSADALWQPVVYLGGVRRLQPAGSERYRQIPASGFPMAGDASGVFAVAVPHGTGLVIAISDAGMVDNAHLADVDNALFATRSAEAFWHPGRRQILFDEYHQNYRADESLWNTIGHAGRLAFGQVVVLLALMIYSGSRRFGLPEPGDAPSRVSSEYVRSLARLYRRAGGSDIALQSLYDRFWSDLCGAAELPGHADPYAVAQRLALLSPDVDSARRLDQTSRIVNLVSQIRAVLNRGASLPAEPMTGARGRRAQARSRPSENELLRLVSEMEALRRELEVGPAGAAASGI
jgi:hypothetical protein